MLMMAVGGMEIRSPAESLDVHPEIMKISFLPLILLSVCLTNPLSAAAEPVAVLEPVLVSASRIPGTLEETTASMTLISREEIEARQPASMVDLLRHVSGLHVDQPGGRGGVSSVYIRGADPNFTVVLIDGVKVNDPTNSRGGGFDFSMLDPENIERIEIVRGAVSSVYGSDAMGGLIKITTRRGTNQPRFSSEAGAGSQGDHHLRLSTGGPLKNADYRLSVSYADDGAPVQGSRFIGKNIQAHFTSTPSNQTWLTFVSRYGLSESERNPEDSGGPEFAVRREVETHDAEELTAGLSLNHRVRHGWEYRVKTGFYGRWEESDSPGVAAGIRDPFGIPPNRSDTRFDRSDFQISTLFSPLSSVHMGLGAEVQYENGESSGTLFFPGASVPHQFKRDRTLYAPFFEARYASLWGLTLEGSVRMDDAEHFDPETSARFGAAYHIASTGTTLKSTWAQGFKLPSFFALGNAIVGNPELRPETSENFEIGVVQAFFKKRLHMNGTFFYNQWFNLIDFEAGPPPQLVNRSEVISKGAEFEWALQAAESLSANAHLTYTKTEIAGSGEALRKRPEWRGGLDVHWRVASDITGTLGWFYVGKTHDSSIATGDLTLGDYTRVDVSAIWAWSANGQLIAAVDNVLDTRYEEAVGFPAPGIRVRMALRLTL